MVNLYTNHISCRDDANISHVAGKAIILILFIYLFLT